MDTTLDERIRDRIEAEKARTEPPPDAVAVPLIPTGRYTDPAFYELERERIFARTWLFAGHESEWPENGSYRLTDPVRRADRGRAGRRRRAARLLQLLSAPRRAGHPRRVRHGPAPDVPVPLVVLRHRRHPQGGSRRTQLRRARPRRTRPRPGALRGPRRLGVRQRGPRRRAARWSSSVRSAEQMADIDGPSMRAVGTQVHRLDCNWKLMVDAFLEVYHVRTVHPDNAALLYDDQFADRDDAAQRPQPPHRREAGHVPRHADGVRRARQPGGAAAVAPDVDVVRHLPEPGRTDGHRRVHVPVHVAHRRRHDRARAALVRTGVVGRRGAPGAPGPHDALRDRDGPGHREHGADPGVDLVARRAALPHRLARAAHPPLRARGRPGDRPGPPAGGHRGVDALDGLVEPD